MGSCLVICLSVVAHVLFALPFDGTARGLVLAPQEVLEKISKQNKGVNRSESDLNRV